MNEPLTLKPYYVIEDDLDDPNAASRIYRKLAREGKTCYKSENNITDENAEQFVRKLIENGHEAMLEHASLTVRFIVDRGISHEIVRHRLASFAQESTRYCNYSKGKFGNALTFIRPFKPVTEAPDGSVAIPDWWPVFMEEWNQSIKECNDRYGRLMDAGVPPEWARDILINSLKTELVVTCNLREWRNILKLRAAGVTGKPHPQMLEVMVPLLNELRDRLPAVFYDIEPMNA